MFTLPQTLWIIQCRNAHTSLQHSQILQHCFGSFCFVYEAMLMKCVTDVAPLLLGRELIILLQEKRPTFYNFWLCAHLLFGDLIWHKRLCRCYIFLFLLSDCAVIKQWFNYPVSIFRLSIKSIFYNGAVVWHVKQRDMSNTIMHI